MQQQNHRPNKFQIAPNSQLEQFKKDVLIGLSKKNKQLPSKYFYDKKGCVLFNKITEHKDYYLTRSEIEIIKNYRKYLSDLLSGSPFNLIELGPGEGVKTLQLFEQFITDSLDFTYWPIDIANDYLLELSDTLTKKMPLLKVAPIQSDYIDGLNWLSHETGKRNVVMFLGSSIGNFDMQTTKKFLKNIWQALNHDDYVLIGFDLRKDVTLLMKAYDDSDGLTKEFNLNLLRRLNTELGANFNIDNFIHYPTYNPQLSAMESYLLSTITQIIRIKALNKVFYFEEYEPIHLEYSHKYTLRQIESLAQYSGFSFKRTFVDSKNYFADVLWQVIKK